MAVHSSLLTVAQIGCGLTPGPFLTFLTDLSAALHSRSTESQIINVDLEEKGGSVPLGLARHQTVLTKRKGLDWSFITRLSNRLKKNGVRLVHMHNLEAATEVTIAARLAGAKIVLSHHIQSETALPRLIWMLQSEVVATSAYSQKYLESHHKVSSSKVQLIYHGVNLGDYDLNTLRQQRDALRAEWGVGPETLVLGALGPLHQGEDVNSFIQAFARLKQKELDAVAVIAGEGPMDQVLRQLSKDLGVQDSVRFLGPRTDIPAVLSAMDVLVVTAGRYARPLTIMQAMAAGKPVIVTKVGANPEIIEERKTGYLIPCGFPDRLETAVMRLKAIDTLVSDLGLAARARAEALFSMERVADEYRAMYARVLNNRI